MSVYINVMERLKHCHHVTTFLKKSQLTLLVVLVDLHKPHK